MHLRKDGDIEFVLGDMEKEHLGLLQAVPTLADPEGDHRLRTRLFPEPVRGEGGEDIHKDWEAYVRPDLERHFRGAVATVVADLEGVVTSAPKTYELKVSADHVEHWFSALNQARLSINANHSLPEDGEIDEFFLSADEHLLEAFVRSQFYGVIQEWLVSNYMEL